MKIYFLIFFGIILKWQNLNYKDYYAKGSDFFSKKNYKAAASNFTHSYNLKQLSQTAYYISLSYNYLDESDSCKKYANIVLNNPTALEKYKTEAKKMVSSKAKNQTAMPPIIMDEIIVHDS